MNDKKKILIVDDSKMIRKGLAGIFEKSDSFEVIGEAADGKEALAAIKKLQPDVVTLDVVMPGMDGLTTLKHIMIECPRPTVMLSSLTQDGTETTFDALRYGAVDFISKPSRLENQSMDDLAEDIINKINIAEDIDVGVTSYIRTRAGNSNASNQYEGKCGKLVGLGAAEGGYRALMKIIPHLVSADAAYLVVLYAEDSHVDAFAAYLNKHSKVTVKRAENDEVLQAGVCYLSAGSDYMTVHEQDDDFVLHVSPAPFASRKGSVDRLLFSVAEAIGDKSIGVVLSGASVDGSEGLEEIERVQGVTIVQEPKSCLAQGMSKSAIDLCSPDYIVSDVDIPTTVNELLSINA